MASFEQAAETAAEAISKLLTSMSLMIEKMSTLFLKGGIGLGNLIESGINKADVLVTEWTTIEVPPPPDATAETIKMQGGGAHYTYMHYCELKYADMIEEAESPFSSDVKELERLRGIKADSGDMATGVSVAIENKKQKLAEAEAERDQYPDGTPVYNSENTECDKIKKELDALIALSDESYDNVHEKEYGVSFGNVTVNLSLDFAIERLENSIKAKEEKIKPMRDNYKRAVDAKRQYTSRVRESIGDWEAKIAKQEEAKSECTTDGCRKAADNAIKRMNDEIAKANTEIKSWAAQEDSAIEQFDTSNSAEEEDKNRNEETANTLGSQAPKAEDDPDNVPPPDID